MARAKTTTARGKTRGRFQRIDPLTSLLLIFPLFLTYEVGILLVPGAYNGADLITAQLVRLLDGQVGLYIAINAALAFVFLAALAYFRRSHNFDARRVWSVLLESTLYALSTGTLICFVMIDLLGVDPRLTVAPLRAADGAPAGLLGSVIVSLGAGVHEELLFRVVLLGGIAAFLEKVAGVRRFLAVFAAFVVSSVLFSAAHHLVEPFRLGAFVYRVLCGLFFACLYQFRGLAIAVYTHAIYDIYVFLFR